jgi:protocatechuate 3,4-dioxygenase beta subunit
MKKTQAPIRLLLALLLAFALADAATAQQSKKEAQLRTVHGSVLDSNQAPVGSSVVYLKNMKTQAVKTHIADDSGTYRFTGLDPNVDYQIHAEHGDMISPDRAISSFDNRKDMEIILKLKKKG